MHIGKYSFDTNRRGYIMGILNVTPDSFSDGGNYNQLDKALFHAEEMIKQGASILDVGGESTRPGYTQISNQEEIERVVPVISKLKESFDVPISLDTYKADVAKAGIEAGADMINDIWGLRYDEGEMSHVIADSGVACCLMHNREAEIDYCGMGDVIEADLHPYVMDLMGRVSKPCLYYLSKFCKDIDQIMKIAGEADIKGEQIVLDPGIGFGKSYEQNLMTIRHLDILKNWNLPILLGTSRKRVIGRGSGDLPVEDRDEGTAATTVFGRMKGASFFRVHNCQINYRELVMIDSLVNCDK